MNNFRFTMMVLAAVLMTLPVTAQEERPVLTSELRAPIEIVFQIDHDEYKDGVLKGLFSIDRFLMKLENQGLLDSEVDIHAVVHGKAAAHLLSDKAWRDYDYGKEDNPNSALIDSLLKRGVSIELCDTRRQAEGWKKSEIHLGVTLVEAALLRILELQQRGYLFLRL